MSDEPQSGRCARCRELTVLERVECVECTGTGRNGAPLMAELYEYDEECRSCNGLGYTESTPCCGRGLVDEAAESDEAYEQAREAHDR